MKKKHSNKTKKTAKKCPAGNPSKTGMPNDRDHTANNQSFSASEEQRFTDLYHQHFGWAEWRARKWGAFDSESTASKALLRTMFRHNPALGGFRTLLFIILRGECVSQWRKKMINWVSIEDALEEVEAASSFGTGADELADELEFLLSLLSPQEQLLVRLKYLEGFSYEEIINIIN